MARNTSILLGEYFESFINEQIASGKYSSVSEVVRTALRVFEEEENKTKSLILTKSLDLVSSKKLFLLHIVRCFFIFEGFPPPRVSNTFLVASLTGSVSRRSASAVSVTTALSIRECVQI